ncbi:MAG: erythrose-4-phosphate dehydrogenase [Rhodocyclaceae bacterium]|nr:erythrose-4-phosphate dehydrogenase [Rhodocyclaceae bacterium]
MNPRLAINGYGRIGRCFLRALLASPLRECLSVVAINEPANIDSMAYLTRFDSTHGSFPGVVRARNGCLEIDGRDIAVSHATTPDGVDWQSHGVDLLIEASGRYSRREDLEKFLHTGCPRLLLSQPGASADDVDRTLVFGFNHETLGDADRIVSAGSCTTNALVPILSILDENFGVEHAIATTMHSVMNDQPLIDGYHPNDLRMTRSAMQSMIPVETGLARGVARFLPALESRITAKAIRVPTCNVSAIDLVVNLARATSASEVARLLRAVGEAGCDQIVEYSDGPHASIDFNHDPCSVIVDGSQIRTSGDRLLNLLLWFDNEWAFASRMLDLAAFWCARQHASTEASR